MSSSWTPLGPIERFWTFLGLSGATLGSFLVRFVDDLGLMRGRFETNLERRAHQTRRQRSNKSNAAHTVDSIKHIPNFCQLVQTCAPSNAIAQQSKSKTSATSCKRWCMKTPSSNNEIQNFCQKLLSVSADVSA